MQKNPMPLFENHEKFLSKIKVIQETECWEWQACIEKGGYGRYHVGKRKYLTHRLSYYIFNGFENEDNVIDHKCRNRACCNPEHLREVSGKVNATRNSLGPTAINSIKTHCINNHEFNDKNTRITKTGNRRCIPCIDIYNQRAKERKNASRA